MLVNGTNCDPTFCIDMSIKREHRLWEICHVWWWIEVSYTQQNKYRLAGDRYLWLIFPVSTLRKFVRVKTIAKYDDTMSVIRIRMMSQYQVRIADNDECTIANCFCFFYHQMRPLEKRQTACKTLNNVCLTVNNESPKIFNRDCIIVESPHSCPKFVNHGKQRIILYLFTGRHQKFGHINVLTPNVFLWYVLIHRSSMPNIG